MSIRIGNELYNIPGLVNGSRKTTKNTGSGSVRNSSASASFASELSSSIAALGVTGNNALTSAYPYANIGSSMLYNGLNSLYSGLSYNSLNTTGLSQNYWGRNDFPLEALFGNGNASSILNWAPQGTEPASNSASVLNRLNSTLGMKAIVIAPELESKVNNSSQLMQDVMDKISNYIRGTDDLFSGKEKSDALILDGNGNISHYRTFVKDTGLISPAETEFAAGRTRSRIYVTNGLSGRIKNNG